MKGGSGLPHDSTAETLPFGYGGKNADRKSDMAPKQCNYPKGHAVAADEKSKNRKIKDTLLTRYLGIIKVSKAITNKF